ncbi:reticulon-3 isoform X1 [Esox lucius]|uniref:Reticulon n=1 Tax=Esox lucius TaxID=8010 RepID=A0AAY5KHR6_ESOLU|nr:reticulon-3 isoform X1 [Esox lucius]
MADPMTQSAQISSSPGLADGQNSVAAKDSKMSDSFLSSSPVSLIQSPQDKKVVLGSDKPCPEGVATSLRFTGPSQPGSFSPANHGRDASSGLPDGKPDDSPVVTSPVSERIKALEALAAKKKEPELKNEGGFPHFKERHYEKSAPEVIAETTSPFQKKGASTDQESPESPFEVLGEARQGSEFEDTADWMRAHLPPVPAFEDKEYTSKDDVSENGGKFKEVKVADKVVPDISEAFACVPDAFMDSPIEGPQQKNLFKDPGQHSSVEEESEFDLSFLPTAYMTETQGPLDVELPASPAPPAGFDTHSPPPSPPPPSDSEEKVSKNKQVPWGGDLEPPEVVEADSSGDSDDTVIEDAASIPASSLQSIPDTSSSGDAVPAPNPSVPSVPTEEKETLPAKQPMRVPTINVIETDEPNYSDMEMEMEEEEEQEEESCEVVKDSSKYSVQEAPKTPEPQPNVTENKSSNIPPLEYQGYSPPSSPVDSDAEYSPKHKILKSEYDPDSQTVPSNDGLQSSDVTKDSSSDSQRQKVESEKSQTSNESNEKSTPNTGKPSEKATENLSDFPDYDDDDWSADARDILFKSSSGDNTAEQLPFEEKLGESFAENSDLKDDYIQTNELSKSNNTLEGSVLEHDRESLDEDPRLSIDDSIGDKGLNVDAVPEPPQDQISEIHIGQPLPQNNATTVEEDITSVDEEDSFPKPVGGQPSPREFPRDPFSSFQSEPPGSDIEPFTENKLVGDILANSMAYSQTLPPQDAGTKDTKAGHHSPDNTSDPESIEPDCSVAGATDSFVEFMRECLKSRQDEDPGDLRQGLAAQDECPQTGAPPSQSSPTVVMDLEQERLTIDALKELGSSQEEDDPQSGIVASEKSLSSVTSATTDQLPQNKPASDSTYSEEVEAIDVWVAEAYHLAEHVLTAILTHFSVQDLVHWRDPKKSGVVFGLSLLALLSLAAFSVISVVSYLLLALLCVTISFRIYKSVVQAVQKSNDGHPFKALIEKDVSVPPETFRKHVDASLTYINRLLKQLSRLFLVEDLIDSLKLAVVMWLLTYVGAVFNGITIFILADILLFTVPPFYEKYKTQIDHYIGIARTQVNTTMAKLQEKLPGAIKRTKAE